MCSVIKISSLPENNNYSDFYRNHFLLFFGGFTTQVASINMTVQFCPLKKLLMYLLNLFKYAVFPSKLFFSFPISLLKNSGLLSHEPTMLSSEYPLAIVELSCPQIFRIHCFSWISLLPPAQVLITCRSSGYPLSLIF